jgi:hypothetical protein
MLTGMVKDWELIHRNSTHTDLRDRRQSQEAPTITTPPNKNHSNHTTSATTMPSVFSNPPGSQSSSPSRPDARRLLPESTTPLEPLVARLLAPYVVANPRKGASRRPAHAAAIPFAAEMLDAERRLVSRDFRQQLRDASIRRSRQGGTWRRCGQTAITKPLGRWRGGQYCQQSINLST